MKTKYRFHKLVFLLLLPAVALYARLKFNYRRGEKPVLNGPCLILCNHVTNYDLLFVAACLRQHMYFVGSEHIFALGSVSKLLKIFFDPIARPKGSSAASTVRQILRRLHEGESICLFAEGNSSWDGGNSPILPATGKLCRISGAKLVTMRIEGGYFTFPRWASTARRGRVTCNVVGVYTPEQLKVMDNAEVNAIINRDLREEAYERQNEWKQVRYKGKKRAENIEHVLVMCPKCGKIGSIRSIGNAFACDCGMRGEYDEYGGISGAGFEFTNIRDWHKWILSAMDALPDTAGEREYAHDNDLILYEIDGHLRREVARGRTSMTNRGFYIGERSFLHEDISDMAVRTKGTVSFSTRDGAYYELRSPEGERQYSGHKYELLHVRFVSRMF